MNAIQQISLKLQMGIDPATDVEPELLRSMWGQLSRERAETLDANLSQTPLIPARATHPSVRKAG